MNDIQLACGSLDIIQGECSSLFSYNRQCHPIEGFYVSSYQANFASHHTRDRHVCFLSAQDGIGKKQQKFHYFLFSSYHITELQLSDRNITTHTQLKF